MTEELQVIVQAMTQLGSEARFAFIAWLVAKYGMHYLTVVAVFSIIAFVACKIVAAVKVHSAAYRVALAVNKACGNNQHWFDAHHHLKDCLEWIGRKSEGK